MTQIVDSRTSSILLNLNLNLNQNFISKEYLKTKNEVEKAQNGTPKKVYKTLKSAMNECYLTGSLQYGNNFIM